MAIKSTKNSVGTIIKPTSTNMKKKMEKVRRTKRTRRRGRLRRIKTRLIPKTKTKSQNHARKSSRQIPSKMMKIDTSAET